MKVREAGNLLEAESRGRPAAAVRCLGDEDGTGEQNQHMVPSQSGGGLAEQSIQAASFKSPILARPPTSLRLESVWGRTRSDLLAANHWCDHKRSNGPAPSKKAKIKVKTYL